jgi:hypothetical protein
LTAFGGTWILTLSSPFESLESPILIFAYSAPGLFGRYEKSSGNSNLNHERRAAPV